MAKHKTVMRFMTNHLSFTRKIHVCTNHQPALHYFETDMSELVELPLRDAIEAQTGERFDCVLCNLYPEGELIVTAV
jgi:hypothetical protein